MRRAWTPVSVGGVKDITRSQKGVTDVRNIVSHRPSPAFVLAAIALLVALGGTSVAAVKDAAPNSVGSAQLKANAVTNPKIATGAVSSSKLANGAVTGGKIASRAVTGAKIAANAITTTQVAQGSLLSSDFGAGQIPRGPTGPAGFQGTPGIQGPPGLSGVQIVSASTSDSTDGVQFVTAACPSGKKVIGGGAQATGTAVASAPVSIRESNPTAAGTGWHAVAGSPFNFDTAPDAWNVTATAICANTT
jgi:hypothetical protein